MNFKSFFKFFSFILLLVPHFAVAHVGYVLSDKDIAQSAGGDWAFILYPLTNPWNIVVIVGSAVLIILFYLLLSTEIFEHFMLSIRKRTGAYLEFVPWVCRLALGIALIGAGTEGFLVSPLVSTSSGIAFVEILIGFLILIGFMIVPAMIVALILFVLALFTNIYILGNLDFLVLIISYLILADARPGLDDLLCIPQTTFLQKIRQYVPLILRLGLGGAMIFLAIYEKFLNPASAALIITQYGLDNIVPVSPAMWILSAGIIELALGLLIISGFFTRTVMAIAFFVTSLSFFYFGESVTAHITLFSTFSLLFITGGGKWSFDHFFYHRKHKTDHLKSVNTLW